MRADAPTVEMGAAGRPASRALVRWLLAAGLVAVTLVAAVGFAFAGSEARLAEGVTVAGIDVGGLTERQALLLLERRAASVARVPIVFTAGEQQFPIEAATLGVRADWGAALDTAARTGEGFGLVRGFKRLQTRFFGAEIAPPVEAYDAALDFKLGRMRKQVDRPHVEAKLVRRGLAFEAVAGHPGLRLDREAAADTIVRALARFERRGPVPLPVHVVPVTVHPEELAPALGAARTAVSAPVRLTYRGVQWRLPRWRVATLLSLPRNGATALDLAGKDADRWFGQLRKTVDRPPKDATLIVGSGNVRIEPERDGALVDVPATKRALLAAATRPTNRAAVLVVNPASPKRTVADVEAMGIERRLGTYTTLNAGTSDRITNLRRAIELLHGALVPPDGTFSFNQRVGERTIERGFRPAPVIIKDAYEEDVGGGVSQVATTVFNAAWESGVKILERNPHSLYISRYQVGRDATVNYPDLDLKFLNDTPAWIYVAGSWDDTGITVSLYGGGPRRRVVSSEGTMRETGPAREKRTPDPTLEVGTEIVDEPGSPSSATSVKRTVYNADGSVLYDETWNTSYRSEFREIRYGTKPKPKPVPPPPPPTTPEPDPTPTPPKRGEETPPGGPPPTPSPPAPPAAGPKN